MSEQPEALWLADAITHPEGEPTWETCVKAAAELRRLHEENERLRDDYLRTCGLVADMHAAATGGHDGPRRGVVEDIQDLRSVNQELLGALQLMNVDCQYLHHAKSDCHSLSEPCPVEQRIRAAIAKTEGETK